MLDFVDGSVAGYLASHMFDGRSELLQQAIVRYKEELIGE